MLPKIDLPKYTTTLPVSKQKIKYRPYTTKEEKILILASNSDNEQDKRDAVAQIVENCTGIDDITELHPTDFEWLFLKLRACSTSNIVDVVFGVDNCADNECPTYIAGQFNIDDVKVEDSDYQCPFKERGSNYIIPVTDNVGMLIKKQTTLGDNDYESLYNSLVSVYQGDNIYPKSGIAMEDFETFVDQFPVFLAEQLQSFFTNSVPIVKCNVGGKCEKCGKSFEYEVKGIKDFFG